MCLYSIATDYNGSLEADQAHNGNDRYDMMIECGSASSSLTWTSSGQLRGCSIGSTIATRMLMCLYSIATDYNGSLEAAQAHIDDDRYDMIIECGSASSSLTWTSSGQLRGCSIGSTIATRMSSANVLV